MRTAAAVAFFAVLVSIFVPAFDGFFFDPSSLAGKRVVVAGASQGIGADVARYLTKHGAKVMVAARNEEKLKAVAASCDTLPVVHRADLADPKEAQLLVDHAVAVFGGIDMLILNHAVSSLLPSFSTCHHFPLSLESVLLSSSLSIALFTSHYFPRRLLAPPFSLLLFLRCNTTLA